MSRPFGARGTLCALLFLLAVALGVTWLGRLTRAPATLSLPYSPASPNGWTAEEDGDRRSLSRTLEEPEGFSVEFSVLRVTLNGQSGLCAELDGERIFASPDGGRSGGLIIFSLPEDYSGKTLALTWTQTSSTPFFPSVTLTTPYQEQAVYFAQASSMTIPAAASLTLALLTLGLFFLTGALEKFEWRLLPLALGPLSQAFYWWAQMPQNAATSLLWVQLLSWSNQAFCWLPVLFLIFQARKKRPWLIAWGVLAVMAFGLSPLLSLGSAWIRRLPPELISGLIRLPVALELLGAGLIALLSAREWKRGDAFFRLYAPPLLAAAAGVALYALLSGKNLLTWNGPSSPTYVLFWCAQILALAVSLIRFIQISSRRNSDLRTLSARVAMTQDQLAVMNESSQSLREQSHDTRHHYAVLRGLLLEGQTERAKEYLDGLTAQADAIPVCQYTVHPAVNAVLTTVLARAGRQDIRVTARVDLPERLSIPDGILCTLLMNLLENALEANESAPAGAEKWLKVHMYVDGLYLFVGVENSRFAPVEYDGDTGMCRSTKAGDGHGFGLRAAQTIARKYGSELLVEVPDGAFSVSTALLMNEHAEKV